MRGRPSIYAFSGILGVHISGDVVENQMLQIVGDCPICDGPRTRRFCILLNDRTLWKTVVRGPSFFEGTANKIILHYVVSQWITNYRCSRSDVRRRVQVHCCSFCSEALCHSGPRCSVILSVSEESGAVSRHRAPSGTPDPSLMLRMTMDAQDDNALSSDSSLRLAAASMETESRLRLW